MPNVELLHFGPGPWRAAEKLQTRFNAGIVFEAADIDVFRQRLPTVVFDQDDQNFFECDAVQRIWRGVHARNLGCDVDAVEPAVCINCKSDTVQPYLNPPIRG